MLIQVNLEINNIEIQILCNQTNLDLFNKSDLKYKLYLIILLKFLKIKILLKLIIL